MNDFEEKVVEELIGQIPVEKVYEDAAQPAMQTTGRTLDLFARAFNAALEPLHKWTLQKEYNIKSVEQMLENKLRLESPESIVPPDLHIAGPVLQALPFVQENDELKKMYANLLASSMTIEGKTEVHPCFVEIIKQISPDEAKILSQNWILPKPVINVEIKFADKTKNVILRSFSDLADNSGCEYPQRIQFYIENLARLKLLDISFTSKVSGSKSYDDIEGHERVQKILKTPVAGGAEYFIQKGSLSLSEFGKGFIRACIG